MARSIYSARIALLVLLCSTRVEAVFAQDDFKTKFLTQYVPAVKKLKEFYRNVRMRASYDLTFSKEIGRTGEHLDLVFKARDPLFLVETTFSEKSYKIEPGTTYIQAVNRAESFALERRVRDGKVLLLRLRGNEDGWKVVCARGSFAFAPYSWNDDTLEDFLGSPNAQIGSWEEVVAGKRKLVKLSYRYRFEKLDYGGWFLFSPGNSWALLEHGRETDSLKLHLTISYENLEDEVPRLKQVSNYEKDPTGVMQEKWDILELVPEAVPEEEFTLSAYGLPEQTRPRISMLWIVLWVALALAILALLLRILVRSRSKRQKT